MRLRRLQVVALAVGLLAGCAQLGPRVVLDKGISFKGNESLQQAFRLYWGLRSKGDFEQAFKMEAPYVQEMVALGMYHNYIRLFSKARPKAIHIYRMESEETFFVTLDCRAVYQVNGNEKTRDFQDRWVSVEGKWYHVLKNRLMFPQL